MRLAISLSSVPADTIGQLLVIKPTIVRLPGVYVSDSESVEHALYSAHNAIRLLLQSSYDHKSTPPQRQLTLLPGDLNPDTAGLYIELSDAEAKSLMDKLGYVDKPVTHVFTHADLTMDISKATGYANLITGIQNAISSLDEDELSDRLALAAYIVNCSTAYSDANVKQRLISVYARTSGIWRLNENALADAVRLGSKDDINCHLTMATELAQLRDAVRAIITGK